MSEAAVGHVPAGLGFEKQAVIVYWPPTLGALPRAATPARFVSTATVTVDGPVRTNHTVLNESGVVPDFNRAVTPLGVPTCALEGPEIVRLVPAWLTGNVTEAPLGPKAESPAKPAESRKLPGGDDSGTVASRCHRRR